MFHVNGKKLSGKRHFYLTNEITFMINPYCLMHPMMYENSATNVAFTLTHFR